MRTAGVAFVLACLVSVLLTPFMRRFALAHGLFDDQLSARKIHGRPIPRLGGVAAAKCRAVARPDANAGTGRDQKGAELCLTVGFF